MNYDALTDEQLEALTATESTWTPLQHIAANGNTPAWQTAAESIDTQSSSIHGKGTK